MKEKIRLNVEAIEADMKKMGLTSVQVSRSVGMADNYLASISSATRAGKTYGIEVAERIERALFRESGAYRLKIEEKKEQEEKPQGGGESDTDRIRKDLNDMYIMQKAIYDELRTIHSDMKELLFATMNNTSTTKEYAKRVHDDCYKLTQLWGGK